MRMFTLTAVGTNGEGEIMRVAPRTLLAACVAAALVLHAGDAVAADPPSPGEWGGADCASGSLDGFEMHNRDLVLYGTATRCGDDETAATFGVAFFRADAQMGGVYGTGVRWYSPHGQLRAFGVQGPRTPATWGACVMRDSTVRLACGVLAPSPIRPGWSYTPVPLDHPLVAKPVSPLVLHPAAPGNTQPNCGGCF
jgi:hypothetical protein